MGNHDKGASNYQRAKVQKYSSKEVVSIIDEVMKEYSNPQLSDDTNRFILTTALIQNVQDNKLFDEVYEGVLAISDKIILSHEPVDIPFMFNLHGHDHSNWYKGKQHLNLCAEHINYTPVSLGEIIKSGVLSKIPNIHRVTIDKAVERKGKKK